MSWPFLLGLLFESLPLPSRCHGAGPLAGRYRRPGRLSIESLEDRMLPSGGINEFLLRPPGNGLNVITTGPDGNLWFTEYSSDKIGQMSTDGTLIEEIPLNLGSHPKGITTGPDGNLWFTESGANQIGRLTTDGIVTEFPLPPGSSPFAITTGPDGNLWFTEFGADRIGMITTDGSVGELRIPSGQHGAFITVGPDGNLWFTETVGRGIGRIDWQDGNISEFMMDAESQSFRGITTGPDGYLWFAEPYGNRIGKLDTTGVLIAQFSASAYDITAGSDGNLWFNEYTGNKIGRITPNGVVTEFSIPTAASNSSTITAGPDGNIWFTEYDADQIGKLHVLSVTGQALTATTGAEFEAVVASFQDDQSGMQAINYMARIDWGDGSPLSTGGISDNGDGTWDVTASHVYMASGTYSATITILDTHPGGMTTSAVTTIIVGDCDALGGGHGQGHSLPAVPTTFQAGRISFLLSVLPVVGNPAELASRATDTLTHPPLPPSALEAWWAPASPPPAQHSVEAAAAVGRAAVVPDPLASEPLVRLSVDLAR